MPLIKTSNPALGQNTFDNLSGRPYGSLVDAADRMTLNGTVNKTGVLLLCCVATAAWTWHLFLPDHDMTAVSPLMMVGVFGGFIVAMITTFKRQWAPVTAPIYALLEGLFLGGISAMFELHFQGIPMQAVGLTFATLFAMLFLYSFRIIKVTQKFRLGVFAATGGIMIFYFLQMILGFFGVHAFSSIGYGSSPLSIGISFIIVGVAALNLVLDFDFIEYGVQSGAPKYMEWYGAFGIMVTLVWLYLEMLRLLSKLNSRN